MHICVILRIIFVHFRAGAVFLVTRIVAQSEKHGMLLHLDVNTEIYPMKKGERFVMVLSPTLNWNGAPVTSYQSQVIGFCLVI